MMSPDIVSFFDEATHTVSHIVIDPKTGSCAIVDSVLDFDICSGRTHNTSAGKLINYVKENGLKTEWILETHAHADHLSAAPYLQETLGGKIAIGAHIPDVQKSFGDIFNLGDDFDRDGCQFCHLFADGDVFHIGEMEVSAMHVPGHTSACMAYYVGDAVFVGDTLFMPDFGSARCDFPGGNAGDLYDSVQRLYQLPDETRMFLCHDYKAKGRDYFAWETTIGAQKKNNLHLNENVSREEFIELRSARDATLSMPKLILPSVQVNIRAGHLPEKEDNGVRYLKIPLDSI